MSKLADEVSAFREKEIDAANVMKAFDEIDAIYKEGLKAMGLIDEQETEPVLSSSDVTISAESSCLSSGYIAG